MTFRACDIAKQLNIKPANIRVWLSRDKGKGMVKKTPDKKGWMIADPARITIEIDRIKRAKRNITGGSRSGSSKAKKDQSPQLCRLHNVQFYARLIDEDIKTIPKKMIDWDSMAPGPGSKRWIINRLTVPVLMSNAKIIVSAGKNKASIQAYFQPFYTNSLKIFDQLEATHNAAQQLLNLLSHQYKFQTGLLEVSRPQHFTITIPVKEGWRIADIGFGMKGGKVWVNETWWIDASYGNELETANAVAFKELVELPGKVQDMAGDIGEILEILKKPAPQPPDPRPPEDIEVA